MKYLVTENEFLSAAVNAAGELEFTRDNGVKVRAGKVRPDLTPELQVLRDDTVAAAAAVEAVGVTNDSIMAANVGTGGAFDSKLATAIVPVAESASTNYLASHPEVADAAAAKAQSDAGLVRTTDRRLGAVTAGDIAWRLTDAEGRSPFMVLTDGTVVVNGVPLRVGASSMVEVDRSTGYAFAIMDEQRRPALAVTNAGDVDLNPSAGLIDRLSTTRVDPRVTSGYDIIVGAGQSNMHGAGVPWLASADIPVEGLDQWDCTVGSPTYDTAIPAVESLNAYNVWRDGANPRTSPLAEMGRQWAFRVLKPRRVLIVPAALGSTSMAERWNPASGDLYAWMIARIAAVKAAAPAGSRFVGFVWGQGEGDAGTMNTATYQAHLEQLYAGVNTAIGYPVPFIVNGMNPDWVGANAGRIAIQTALKAAAESTPLGRFVPGPAGMGQDAENIHYNAAGTRELGRRDAAALTALRTVNALA